MIEEPPVVLPDAPVAEPRHKWAWIILWVIFALLLIRAVQGSYVRPKSGADYQQEELLLKQSVSLDRLMGRLREIMPDERSRKQIESANQGSDAITPDMLLKARTDPVEAEYLAAYRYQRKRPIEPQILDSLKGSRSPVDRAIGEIYQAKTLTQPQADRLARVIPPDSYVRKVAIAHAYAKAGDKQRLAAIAPLWKLAATAVLVTIVFVGFLVGCCLLLYFVGARRAGQFQPLGHPFEPLSRAGADALALRASELIAGFLVLSEVGALALFLLPSGIRTVAYVATMIAFVGWLFNREIFGKRFSLNRLGITWKGFGKNLLWGLGGYLANIPLLVLTALAVSVFSKYFPAPHHPANDVLANHPTPLVLFGLWLQACVLAPFWEEIMFRGCLFPALTRITGKPIWGAVISSLMFASIHPQGVVGWLPIATIGAMNCLLAYQTRSLVPCMILHAVNNTVTLGLGLLILSK